MACAGVETRRTVQRGSGYFARVQRYHRCRPEMLNTSPTASDLSDAVWIALLDPTDEERARVEHATKHVLPTKADIEEIESSSRVYFENGAAYLSSPILEHDDCLNAKLTSVGFVLSPGTLVTQRFSEISVFETVARAYANAAPSSPMEVFLKILETTIEQLADA